MRWIVHLVAIASAIGAFVALVPVMRTGEISAVCVLTGVHIDSQTRKSCPFPAEIVERGRSLVRAYDLPT